MYKKADIHYMADTIRATGGTTKLLDDLVKFALEHAEDDPIEFTRVAPNGNVCARNWFQKTDEPTYPYIFKVSGAGVVVIHAMFIDLAIAHVQSMYKEEDIYRLPS